MLKIETDVTNVDVINSIVIPRLKHAIDHRCEYEIKRPSVGKANFIAKNIINKHEIRIVTGLQSTGFIYVLLHVNELIIRGDSIPKIEVRIDFINPTNVTDGVDRFHKILCEFLSTCLEKETRDVIIEYNKIFGDIDNAKVVKISG